MECFVSNIPLNSTTRIVKQLLSGPLDHCNVREHEYHVVKLSSKPNAIVTILDPDAARDFLSQYGVPSNAPRHQKALKKIHHDGKYLRITKGHNEPDPLALESLRFEKSAQQTQSNAPSQQDSRSNLDTAVKSSHVKIKSLHCGYWEHIATGRSSPLAFVSQFADHREGHVIFGLREARVLLGDAYSSVRCRIDIPYRDCRDIILGAHEDLSVSFTMMIAPKFYRTDLHKVDDLQEQMERLSFVDPLPGKRAAPPPKKIRLPVINPIHAQVAGSCFVYRITLTDPRHRYTAQSLLSKNKNMCTVLTLASRVELPLEPFRNAMTRLNYELVDGRRYGLRPFKLRYQIERLAVNGILPASKVLAFLPSISRVFAMTGLEATSSALRRLAREIGSPGPETQARDYSVATLEQLLKDYATSYQDASPYNPYELAKRYNHINLVHKVFVTPSGIRLQGPEPESTNRVLRMYSDNIDDFIRVIFVDEDGGPVRFDARTDQSHIYHERFKGILDKSILICGRSFSYLGFSNSSLRSASCWFMAPLINKSGGLSFAEHVLRDLGDFSHIRTPAKCAARIGQNFTDSNTTIKLKPDEVFKLEMITRNGRDFADGAGTISMELLQEVWKVYGTRRALKPTVLQIRFQGTKGMVALDTRLKGRRLMIRENMRKFESTSSWDLEICGAGFRPLPMILNRQFIKIFEDLDIPMSVFENLQADAMSRLRTMTRSNINTAAFLDGIGTCKASGMATLIRYLGQTGLDYRQDPFICSTVELAVISELRDLKHRGRIPVPEGVTLYGLPDEYGILAEGEIFVITEDIEGGVFVLEKPRVVVTRSPALHPGDVQLVRARDVPANHPLRKLRNAVVFSKWGQRDLPSQLSGGDLDGDIYNIIWDENLVPTHSSQAADYARARPVELDRPVSRKDMSDFFVTFMETDLLGKLSISHLQLSDQKTAGTLDMQCLLLADLASKAVDYPKTGIPVVEREIPRIPPFKPDFMAPDPRVVFTGEGFFEHDEDDDQEDDEAFDAIDSERRPIRYYRSNKTLGHLYRAIDERKFLIQMQKDRENVTGASLPRTRDDAMHRVLRFLQAMADQYGLQYKDYKSSLAQSIRKDFEDSLADIMYSFEPTPHHPLTETEVFAGQILGRQNGPVGKALREQSIIMREHFQIIADHTILRMTKGDEALQNHADDLDELYDVKYSDREFEALPRALACLEIAVTEKGGGDRRLGELQSFKYIAASVCLAELDRYKITTFGSRSGLPRVF